GEQGVVEFIVDTVRRAGANPCPPIVLGVAIGGTFEQAAIFAKLMTARPFDEENPDPAYAALEKRLRNEINALGIGAAGFGGKATCLKVSVCSLPTHIAGMPVAVNVCCHASRHAKAVI
ncbi:MAG: fumarate hydratase, partial [Clostridia bacterium]|nr:fumarate hydratase [Clostridia bacterium]